MEFIKSNSCPTVHATTAVNHLIVQWQAEAGHMLSSIGCNRWANSKFATVFLDQWKGCLLSSDLPLKAAVRIDQRMKSAVIFFAKQILHMNQWQILIGFYRRTNSSFPAVTWLILIGCCRWTNSSFPAVTWPILIGCCRWTNSSFPAVTWLILIGCFRWRGRSRQTARCAPPTRTSTPRAPSFTR
jgi:hypothetical protein